MRLAITLYKSPTDQSINQSLGVRHSQEWFSLLWVHFCLKITCNPASLLSFSMNMHKSGLFAGGNITLIHLQIHLITYPLTCAVMLL